MSVGEHTFTVRATDAAGNVSAAESRTWTVTAPAPDPDTTPPAPVTGLVATADDARVDLRWTNPTAADFAGVKVFRSTTGAATSPDGGTGQTLIYSGTGTGHTEAPLTNGTRYTFTVFALDGAGNASAADVSATPVAPPPPVDGRPTVRVDLGGDARTVDGVAWAACTAAETCGGGTMTGGARSLLPGLTVPNPVAPADAQTYRSEWAGDGFRWARPVAAGRYRVVLHFAQQQQHKVGRRELSVNLEGGATELSQFGVQKAAGGWNRAVARDFEVSVTDGTLNVDVTRDAVTAGMSAIEVIPIA